MSESKSSVEHSLIIAALGVVYGDIGTSPLYAVRLSLIAFGETDERALLGVLSLIAWSLILVVTVKYVAVIMRADNRGEGGLLALTALALRSTGPTQKRYFWITGAGLIGAALFYGDAILTPAISVLSAVEGLEVATPLFEPFVIPIALGLLIGLFAVQRHGTAAVGGLFGPVMLVWFAALAVLGIVNIVQQPGILLALNPIYGLDLLVRAPWRGFLMLGAVFLAATGAEALYADMGHFGRGPMRLAWLYIVLPALLLNYYGQGALLLSDPAALKNPFYRLVPAWGLYPLVALASAATIIASQAVISGAFSITRQAVQLGYLPRLRVLHTSEEEIGQVYVPKINAFLLVAVILLILGFRSSGNLGAAYGIAIAGMMVITSALAFLYMRHAGWSLALALPVFGVFLLIDLAFLASNLLKIAQGGWFPIVVAVGVFTVMATWWRGRRMVTAKRLRSAMPLETFLDTVKQDHPRRIPGTGIVMARDIGRVPVALLHALKHFKVLHERTALLTVETEDIPHVPDEERLEIRDLGKGFYTIRVRYGFMDHPNLRRALERCSPEDFEFNLMETSFIIGRQNLLAGRRHTALARWRKGLFILLSNNMLDATEFFRIPPNRVVELGGQIEI